MLSRDEKINFLDQLDAVYEYLISRPKGPVRDDEAHNPKTIACCNQLKAKFA